MSSYKNWQLLNESMGHALGLSRPTNLGLTGSKMEEMGMSCKSYMGKKYMDDLDFEDEEEEDENDYSLGGYGDEGDEFPPEDLDGEMGEDDFDLGSALGVGDMDDEAEGLGDDEFGDELDVPSELLDGIEGMDPPEEEGFEDDFDDEDLEGIEDVDAEQLGVEGMKQYMKHMGKSHAAFMKSYMKRETVQNESTSFVDSVNPKRRKSIKQESQYADETHDDFLASLANAARNERIYKYKSGLTEDALYAINDPNAGLADINPEPQAGEVGFAPQGRVGSIGGGYTMDDFEDIPTVGESQVDDRELIIEGKVPDKMDINKNDEIDGWEAARYHASGENKNKKHMKKDDKCHKCHCHMDKCECKNEEQEHWYDLIFGEESKCMDKNYMHKGKKMMDKCGSYMKKGKKHMGKSCN